MDAARLHVEMMDDTPEHLQLLVAVLAVVALWMLTIASRYAVVVFVREGQ